MLDNPTPAPPATDHYEALCEIRRQLIEKLRLRYGLNAEEAERRLRALEEEA